MCHGGISACLNDFIMQNMVSYVFAILVFCLRDFKLGCESILLVL